jgi:hypothetical protein
MTWRALRTSLLLACIVLHAVAHSVPRRGLLEEAAGGSGSLGTSPAKITVSKGSDTGPAKGTVSLTTVVGVAIGAGLVVGAIVGFVLLRVRNRRRQAALNASTPITTSVVAYGDLDAEEEVLSPRPVRGAEEPRRLWDASARLPQGDTTSTASRSMYVEVERTATGPAVRLKHRSSPSALPH